MVKKSFILLLFIVLGCFSVSADTIMFSDNCTSLSDWGVGGAWGTNTLHVLDNTWFDAVGNYGWYAAGYYNLSAGLGYDEFNATSNFSIYALFRGNQSPGYNSKWGFWEDNYQVYSPGIYIDLDWARVAISINGSRMYHDATPTSVSSHIQEGVIIRACYNCSGDNKFLVWMNDTLQTPEKSDSVGIPKSTLFRHVTIDSIHHSEGEVAGVDWVVYVDHTSDYSDVDGDGYGVSDGDCDDSDPDINPSEAELCDCRDNDCDGLIDEGCDCVCPTNGMILTENTTFCTGSFILPDGIKLGANEITLDCNGARLIGTAKASSLGVRINDGVYGTTIENCNISNYLAGVYCYQDCYDNIIQQNIFVGNMRTGVQLTYRSHHNLVSNNNFEGNGWNVIQPEINGGLALDLFTHHNTIVNNIFNENFGTGVNLRLTNDTNITNNIFDNNEYSGVFFDYRMYGPDSPYYSFNNLILGNTFHHTGVNDSIPSNNIYCFGCFGNSYYSGAIGPLCSGISEQCNGEDDDCDGDIDEDYDLGQSCDVGVGECQRTGSYVCTVDGTGTECNAIPGQSVDEICDGKDNDCDSVIDENYPELGNSCTVGLGACEATDTVICTVDGTGTICTAVPGQVSDETCNGIDDDCDGSIDENLVQNCYTGPLGTAGVGICQEGSQTCSLGVWGTCEVEVLPSVETCNELDDDCNGITDDVDEDSDGVNDCTDDKCLSSQPWTVDKLNPNHYDSSNMELDTFGCTCEQILLCKPGNNKGEMKFGCTKGTIDIWIEQKSWALDCQEGNQIFEGISKPWYANTDGGWLFDFFDLDNDNDGLTDGQDSMMDDSDPPGDPDHGIPDWHPKSKHKN